MRTLIQLEIRQDGDQEIIEKSVNDWFKRSGFRPKEIEITEDVKTMIRRNDQQNIHSKFKVEDSDNIAGRQAIEILMTVPVAEQERHHALNTAKYVIHFDDHTHGNVVWGLVCIEETSMTVRWRHKVSRSLERASEELVAKIWQEVNSAKLFEPFTPTHRIPVREPNSTTDAYIGEILVPGPRLKDRAKKDKKTELKLGNWAIIGTAICFAGGLALFTVSQPESLLRWVSSAFDRLATTGATTAVVSYLSYYFHVWELQRKPIIDWN